jgi:hypothetical protein
MKQANELDEYFSILLGFQDFLAKLKNTQVKKELFMVKFQKYDTAYNQIFLDANSFKHTPLFRQQRKVKTLTQRSEFFIDEIFVRNFEFDLKI